MRITVRPSTQRTKKLMASFYNDAGDHIKTVHFGGAGYGDFIQYSKTDPKLAKAKRLAYIKRHRVSENWRDPMTAGALSRYLLWEKPSLAAALKKFKVMFNFV